MTSRALLAAGGLLLSVSLFLPWFSGGVSGWEHFAWADVPLALVALVVLAAAALPALPPLRVAVVALGGLAIAVVLGHGFEPDEPTQAFLEVAAGGYVALAALAAAVIGALATWPRRGGALLLVAAAAGLLAALLSGWGVEGGFPLTPDPESAADFRGEVVFYGPGSPDGFERWHVLDVALVALALGLVASAARLPRGMLAALAAGALAAAACIVIGVRDELWVDEGAAVGVAMGPLVALLALAAALAGLAALRASSSSAYR